MTLRVLLLANRVQWYNEPWFKDPFERVSSLITEVNCYSASNRKRTLAACMSEICLNYQTKLSPLNTTHASVLNWSETFTTFNSGKVCPRMVYSI